MAGGVVIRREKAIEPAAVAEHAELLLGLAVGGREHQQQDAQTVGHVGRTEAAGLLQDHGPGGGCEIELLAVWMVAVLQGRQRLPVDLGGGHDPQNQPGLPVEQLAVDEIDHACRQQRLAAAGGNLEAERGQRLTGAGGTPGVRTRRHGLLPGFARPIQLPLRIDRPYLVRAVALTRKLIQ